MIETVLLGLSALASITGVSSGTNFEISNEDYNIIANSVGLETEIDENGDTAIKNVTSKNNLYSISGENRYLELVFNGGGYLIYDKMNNEVVETDFNNNSPYSFYEQNFKIYYNSFSGAKHIVFENEKFYCLDDSSLISNSSIDGYMRLAGESAGQYISNFVPDSNAKFIDNSFYFEKLGINHGINDSGICTIIATQISLGYQDTFYNDNIVDEIYDYVPIETSNTKIIRNFSESPGTGRKNGSNSDQRFRNYLISLTEEEIGHTPVDAGMYTQEQIKLVKHYLNDTGLEYSLNTSEGNWGDQITNRAIAILKNGIENNRPVLVNGTGHSTIAYGYDDSYVFVHTGWGDVAATPWSTFTTKWIGNEFDTGAIDIEMNCEHYHSDNYYSAYYDEYYCPDGFKHLKTVINPEHHGFEAQYFFSNRVKNFVLDNYVIETNRLRTGYIENQFINLSPKREGAGIAFLEYNLPSYIKKITIDVSLWSGAENYSKATDKILIEYRNSNGEWITAIDLLNDIELSTDRTRQNRITVAFPKQTSSFRFYAESNASGDRNKGRLSIGQMEVMHE